METRRHCREYAKFLRQEEGGRAEYEAFLRRELARMKREIVIEIREDREGEEAEGEVDGARGIEKEEGEVSKNFEWEKGEKVVWSRVYGHNKEREGQEERKNRSRGDSKELKEEEMPEKWTEDYNWEEENNQNMDERMERLVLRETTIIITIKQITQG